MGHSEGSIGRKVYNNTALPKGRKISNNLTLPLKQQTMLRVSKRKEIIKIRVELKDIKTKRTIQRINNSSS